MSVYKKFAEVYVRGQYQEYARYMLELMPGAERTYQLPEKGSLLDIACGAGVFACGMASRGWKVTGLDQSAEMLVNAAHEAEKKQINLSLVQGDMRKLPFANNFDLITCWYDSLNYLLQIEDLQQAFISVAKALKPAGYFIFDMNTITGLMVNWQKQKSYIQQDTNDIFEVHNSQCDYENHIASLEITAFIRRGANWEKIREVHKERGYPIPTIHTCLELAGFTILDTLGNLDERTPPTNRSNRIFILAKKSTGGV